MAVKEEKVKRADAPVALPERWQVMKFGDVVRNVNVNEPHPLKKGLERYIGLEHLDPESLHIKRWGLIEEGTSFTRKFIKGQVLFGKRRAYQRKAALAEFDGICSGDILVFESKEDALIPDLLPFVVQSDGFFNHALSTSAGSLSPRTKWKDLSSFEFALPPKDEQRRIAEILWAADESVEKYLATVKEGDTALDKLITHLMMRGLNKEKVKTFEDITCPVSWEIKRLEEIADVDRGKFAHRPRNLPRFYNGPYPFVQTSDVARSRGILRTYEQTLSEEGKAISRSFSSGAILLTIAAIIGKTAVTTFEVWCPDSVVGIEPHKDIDVHFLEFYLRTIQKKLEEKAATQTAQKNINLGVLRPLLICVPSLKEQKLIANLILTFQEHLSHLQEQVTKGITLKKAIGYELLSVRT